ncbi:MAG TPA: 4-hydroxy-tetrahydrodipicolinate synthase [Clostridiales bacterium]|nr:4-hydroxy-tetrahydrodipicolinate synthase [Clostridiales bacterium]
MNQPTTKAVAEWGRVITAMVTPFDAGLAPDYGQAARLARRLVDSGTDAVLVGGTTGESPTLTDNEKLRLIEAVLDAVGDRAPVLAGTGTNSTAASVTLTRKAEALGVHGVMLVAPYYNKPPQAGLIEHFRTVASETRLPVMVYNVPGRTGVNITPETMAVLSEVPNIVALKEAGGSADQAAQMVRAVGGRVRVYSGDDSLTVPMLSVGAVGVVSVASHVAGPLVAEMVAAFADGEVRKAAELHRRLLPLFKALFLTTNPIPVKAALRLQGFDVGDPRPPLVAATPAQVQAIREAMVESGVEVQR